MEFIVSRNDTFEKWGELYELFDYDKVIDDVLLNFEGRIEYKSDGIGIPFDVLVRSKDKTWEKSYFPFYASSLNSNEFYDSKFKYKLIEELKVVMRELNINKILR